MCPVERRRRRHQGVGRAVEVGWLGWLLHRPRKSARGATAWLDGGGYYYCRGVDILDSFHPEERLGEPPLPGRLSRGGIYLPRQSPISLKKNNEKNYSKLLFRRYFFHLQKPTGP